MARPKGTPSYLHHKASGKAFVRIDGKNIYLGFFGTKDSKAEFDRVVSEWLANGRQLPQTENCQKTLTVDAICHSFLEYAAGYYRKNDEITSEYKEYECVVRLLHEHCGRIPAIDFNRQSLKAIREKAVTKGWKRRTVNKRIARIKRIFKWAASEELIPESVFLHMQILEGLKQGRCPCPESEQVLPVPIEDFEKTLKHCPPIIADMARIQFLAGMRPGEVCALRSCDIDCSGEIWEFDYKHHKTKHHGHSRHIWFGEKAQRILTPYLMSMEDDPEGYLFSPQETVLFAKIDKRRKRKSKVQPSQIDRSKKKPKRKPGVKYDVHAYRRAIQRAAEKAGVPQWFPNQLRHTRLTEIRKKYGLEAAQVIGGHAKADITQVYAERDKSKGISVMLEIG